MPLKLKRVWATEDGLPVPDTDAKMYAVPCEACGAISACGSARHGGRFLCLDCLDEVLHPESEETPNP